MANDQGAGLGLYPYKAPFGSIKTGMYRVNTAQDMYRYSPVVMGASGKVEYANIADLASCLGSVIGWLDTNAAGLPSEVTVLSKGAYLPAGTEAFVIVSDDPNQEYVMEADTGGGSLPNLIQSGQTAHWTYEATTGSTVTGISTARIDISTIAQDTGGTLFLLRPNRNMNSDGTVNATSANFCKWVVKIARPQFGQSLISIGT